MRKILVVAMLSTVMLAGCAAQSAVAPSSTPDAGSTALEKPGATPSATAAAPAPIATDDPAEAVVAVDPALYAGFTPYVSASVDFRTPSSNEACGIYVRDNSADVFWGCAIQAFDYALPQRGGADDTCPEQMHLTGGIESHNQDLPKLSCRSDAPFSGLGNPDVPVLEAGTSVSLAGVTCVSGEDSVTCTADSGRGFTLSRSAYSIF